MTRKFIHEEQYRGGDKLASLANLQITLCGAGALGSNLAENLARQGFSRLRVIDRDRVEEQNMSTQIYGVADVGGWKVEVLRKGLFRALEVEIEAVRKELEERNVRSLLNGSDLVIDAFDNARSRKLVQDHCRAAGLPCLHAGLYADYGEVVWDETYRVPQDVAADVCDYPLAHNMVLLTVAVASETVVRYAVSGVRESRSITLQDFAVHLLESPKAEG